MMAALSTDPKSVKEHMDAFAKELFLSRWVRTVRPGDDGDYVYKGFSHKTMLEIMSRGLQRRPARPHSPFARPPAAARDAPGPWTRPSLPGR